MLYIKEPVGVDLNIAPMPLSDEERHVISAIITQYKTTGEVPKVSGKTKVPKNKKLSVSSAKALADKMLHLNHSTHQS